MDGRQITNYKGDAPHLRTAKECTALWIATTNHQAEFRIDILIRELVWWYVHVDAGGEWKIRGIVLERYGPELRRTECTRFKSCMIDYCYVRRDAFFVGRLSVREETVRY